MIVCYYKCGGGRLEDYLKSDNWCNVMSVGVVSCVARQLIVLKCIYYYCCHCYYLLDSQAVNVFRFIPSIGEFRARKAFAFDPKLVLRSSFPRFLGQN